MARHGRTEPRRPSIKRALLSVMLVVGLSIMLYPAATRLVFYYQSVHAAQQYTEVVDAEPDAALEEAWAAALAYNETHPTNVIIDAFAGDGETAALNKEYSALLDPLGNGVMGYVDIPKIGQRLNIYHGNDAESLLKGVSHLQGTSLPVGGESTHCVISGHRGLPSAKLFTDLDRVVEGDLVNLHILDHHLSYEIDAIETVEPTEISSLDIVAGQDRLTLVTCTPYAVNTHRMLVHAHRVPYVEQQVPVVEGMTWLTPVRLALAALLVLVLAALVWLRKPKKDDSARRRA